MPAPPKETVKDFLSRMSGGTVTNPDKTDVGGSNAQAASQGWGSTPVNPATGGSNFSVAQGQNAGNGYEALSRALGALNQASQGSNTSLATNRPTYTPSYNGSPQSMRTPNYNTGYGNNGITQSAPGKRSLPVSSPPYSPPEPRAYAGMSFNGTGDDYSQTVGAFDQSFPSPAAYQGFNTGWGQLARHEMNPAAGVDYGDQHPAQSAPGVGGDSVYDAAPPTQSLEPYDSPDRGLLTNAITDRARKFDHRVRSVLGPLLGAGDAPPNVGQGGGLLGGSGNSSQGVAPKPEADKKPKAKPKKKPAAFVPPEYTDWRYPKYSLINPPAPSPLPGRRS
jgi:hypothetical protein